MAGNEWKPENATLEENFEILEDVIHKMEQGEITLEESFQLYHKGMKVLKVCNDKIETVEKKILVLDNEGAVHEFES